MGVGFVGLHLVECFSRSHKVIGFDVSANRIQYLTENHKHENVIYTNNFNDVKDCKLFCVSVPTLLNDKNDDVDFSYVNKAIAMLEEIATPDVCVVLESSVSIGTSRKLLKSLYDNGVSVGFSPERVDPGRVEPVAHEIAKVVSGYDAKCLDVINKWYSTVYTNVVPVSTMETAEMCKLYENCFRMINIAYSFEVSDACDKHGIDVQEMIDASSTKPYGFMPFYPSLGVGGTCIPVNPYYLFINNSLPLLAHATKASEMRPIKKALHLIDNHKPQRVLVVGLAYKRGQSITYKSPSIPYVNTLLENGVDVHYYDPLVSYPSLPRLADKDFNIEYLEATYDVVCVCMKQDKVDYDVLKKLPKNKVVVF
jgi:nucleotide sugar dehydrogenase